MLSFTYLGALPPERSENKSDRSSEPRDGMTGTASEVVGPGLSNLVGGPFLR